jgi:hypothetical protein
MPPRELKRRHNNRLQLTAPLGGRGVTEEWSRPPRAHSRTGAAADPRCQAALSMKPPLSRGVTLVDPTSRLANDRASCVTAVCKGLYCRLEVAWG